MPTTINNFYLLIFTSVSDPKNEGPPQHEFLGALSAMIEEETGQKGVGD